MSIPLAFINVIIPKSILELKFKGGVKQFMEDYFDDFNDDPKYADIKDQLPSQEDEYLIKIGTMDYSEVQDYIDILTENGLHYDKDNRTSTDFMIIATLGGHMWQVDWLEYDLRIRRCWHKDDPELSKYHLENG
jgi:hypothetical protein